MREIKFRAWDKEEKEMLELVTVGCTRKDSWGPLYIKDKIINGFDHRNYDIMQYTGLKDQNGVEIYEGDILYFEPYKTHSNDRVVEYIDGAYRGRLIRNGYSKLLAECVYETKVIGNIWEDGDLLDGE